MNQVSFFAHGKLLITGEYAVLDGAKALALPTKFGQHLHFLPQPGSSKLHWDSFTQKGDSWFYASWALDSLKAEIGADLPETEKLSELLSSMMREKGLPSSFFEGKITTNLDFPREWGLGTSSTLISLLSQWTGLNAYYLLEKSFGGSGYDIAAATARGPFYYKRNLENRYEPEISSALFNPDFLDHIYFLYSGKKQNSREGIAAYRSKERNPVYLSEISEITEKAVETKSFSGFSALMSRHEQLTGNHLDLVPVQKELFSDFPGVVKSLGAWGGDFLLILSEMPKNEISSYFTKKGYQMLFSYREIIFNEK
jgi:mevalonate kinase